ncbi:MAG: phenylalanine--tRNA ligase subunit beta, partial [Bacteroidota bacterium]
GLESISYNLNRKAQNLKFYEFGKTYHQFDSGRIESKHLSLLVSGNRNDDNWAATTKKTDFYFLKGVIENVLARLGLSKTISSPVKNEAFSEGLTLKYAKKELVSFGVVKKSILRKFDIKQEVLYADFNWDQVLETASHNHISFKDIPKYPEVKRDFALLLENSVTFKEVHDIALQTEKKLLRNVSLFDVFVGKNLPEGKKSYAVSFTLQDEKSTLTDKQIDKIMHKLQNRYEKELGAELR